MKKYRDNGAVGALLDEYEKAIGELSAVLDKINHDQLVTIVDTETDDEDCRSIQTIMTHVIHAGYNYATTIRNHHVTPTSRLGRSPRNTVSAYQEDLRVMFTYTETVFDENPSLPIVSKATKDKMTVSWGQQYDIDQLLEHAIVHILRHRRQIERFLIKMN